VHVSTPGLGGCARANNNVIGGDIAGAGNAVSGNASSGIVLGLRHRDAGSSQNIIGLAANGTTCPNGIGNRHPPLVPIPA
jgi:hypothetical protein